MTTFLLALGTGFVIGCCWEGCRRGGSIDLHLALARRPDPLAVDSVTQMDGTVVPLPTPRNPGRRTS